MNRKRILQITALLAITSTALLVGGCGRDYTAYENKTIVAKTYGADSEIQGITNESFVVRTGEKLIFVETDSDWPNPFVDAENLRISREEVLFD